MMVTTRNGRTERRVAGGVGVELAVTVHAPEVLAMSPLFFLLFPGSGYGRGYFDLPAPRFSQAEAHVAAGHVVVAIDTLGVGDSTILPAEESDLATVVAVNAAVVAALLELARAGALAPGLAAFEPAATIGAGQSMGGFFVTAMQARHRCFDGIALLGTSAVSTKLPVKPGARLASPPDGASAEELAAHAVASIDWPWAFHWDDEEGRGLRDRDIAAGIPLRAGSEPWASATSPGCVKSLMVPGVIGQDAAAVRVPVLIAMGERDVCHAPPDEAAAFKSATDVATFTVARMAHMHNFAATRALLWTRLEQFGLQVAALKAQTALG